MFISTEKQRISLALDNEKESMKSSPVESNLDSVDGLLPASDLPDSPPAPALYTDVSVVPEQQKNELEQSITNLEGRSFRFWL